jgi:hypothetical protein
MQTDATSVISTEWLHLKFDFDNIGKAFAMLHARGKRIKKIVFPIPLPNP